MKKYYTALAVSVALLLSAFPSSYRINSVRYIIDGMTKETSVEREVKIDKTIIFPDEISFAKYIDDYRQRLLNTRLFDEVSVEYSTRLFDEQTDLYIADLTVRLDDSFHFIGMPYPKYDSNSGLTLKLKLKDTNFFGTMKDMSADINFSLERDEDDTEMKHIVDDMGIAMGVNLSFDIPFKLAKCNVDKQLRHILYDRTRFSRMGYVDGNRFFSTFRVQNIARLFIRSRIYTELRLQKI